MTHQTIYFIVVFYVVFLAILGILSINFFGKDNAIEQLAEKKIKEETGLDIDLSP